MSAQTKVAVITGGGAGIGKACALRFAQEGYRVVIADISEEDGHHCLDTIRGDGGEAIFYRGDVSQEVDCQAWAQSALAEWGRIDVLVANAGVQIAGDLFEATEADWERVIGVNLKGVAHSCKAVLGARRLLGHVNRRQPVVFKSGRIRDGHQRPDIGCWT